MDDGPDRPSHPLHAFGVSSHGRYLQQAAWTRELRAYLFDRVGWRPSTRVLEVGCGTGAVLRDFASSPGLSAAAPIPLFGVDVDFLALAECRLSAPTALLQQADARALPFPDGAFDITYCHFLLLWAADPLAALREMKRVTRGHVLALAEPDFSHREDAPAELSALGRLQNDALRQRGADVSIGSRLADLFQHAGLRLRETGIIQRWQDRPGSLADMQAEWDMLEADLKPVLSPTELTRFRRLDAQARRRGARRLFVPTYFAWGQV